jgi:hypothetical protein
VKLRPGLEVRGPCCGGWHVLFQPEGWEQDTTASRGFLYWKCPKAGRGGAFYAGTIDTESDRHPVREPQQG